MRTKLTPVLVVASAIAALIMWQMFHARNSTPQADAALLKQRMAARFGAFEALDGAVRKYEASHGGQIPASVDEAVKSAPELFPPELMERDASLNHNLTQTQLLTDVDCVDPPKDTEEPLTHFKYRWVLVLFVPKATMPTGFARTDDYMRWSGEATTPGHLATGFVPAVSAAGFFSIGLVNAARDMTQATSAPATMPAATSAATQP